MCSLIYFSNGFWLRVYTPENQICRYLTILIIDSGIATTSLKKMENSQTSSFYFFRLSCEVITQQRMALSVKMTSEIL